MKNPNFSYSCSFFPLKIKITTYLKILKKYAARDSDIFNITISSYTIHQKEKG